ncbi:MAG: radical SAM protein, partial [Pseudomonadota bacterium]
VNPLFKDWLEAHYPLRAAHVMSRVRQIRDGRESDVEFGRRLKGQGVFAKLLHKRFEKTCRELGFNQQRVSLSTAHFKAVDQQMSLF